jgi:hypothetical protein
MINSVRNTVLSVINKNNYGYITPADFNLFAKQAQMEIYEEYYSSYNKTINMENARMSGTDYADIEQPIAETLESFLVTNYLSHFGSNKYLVPSLNTTGDTAYYILKMLCHTKEITSGNATVEEKASGNITSVVSNGFQDSSATFLSDGIVEGDVVINTTTGNMSNVLAVASNNTIILTSRIFSFAGQGYMIISEELLNSLQDSSATFLSYGIVEGDIVVNTTTGDVSNVLSVVSNSIIILTSNIFLIDGQGYMIISKAVKEADKVSVGKITMLNASNLTSPNDLYPSYTFEGERINLFPDTINAKGKVECIYFRHPKDPKWTYFTFPNGEPMFDQSQPDYQDFELPLEDEYKLVMKILQYSGISIREQEVAAYALGQEQHEQPTFSQQQ